jgi:small redox-active disulfide protein 2
MSGDVVQMWISGRKVGVIDARRIFAEVRNLELDDPDDIINRLLERAHRVNYIPKHVEDDYREALYREYRRFCGEEVEEARGATEIRILGPGCPRCDELMRRVMTVVSKLDLSTDIRHVRDLKEIASYGPAPTPVLVIDGEIESSGKVLSEQELEKILARKE